MGCVSSKQSNRKYVRTKDHANEDLDSHHVVSLTSSSYGLLNMERSPSFQGSFLSFHRRSKKGRSSSASSHGDFVLSAGLEAEHVLACRHMLIMRGDNEQDSRTLLLQNDRKGLDAMETIDTWELMEGLEDGCRMPWPYRGGSGNNRLRSESNTISFESMPALNSALAESGSPVWKKYYEDSEPAKEGLIDGHISLMWRSPSSPCNKSPQRSLPCMPFVKALKKLPSRSSPIEKEDSRCASSNEPPDRSSPGLKLLLSPAKQQSYYARAVTKRAGIHAASLSFDGNTEKPRRISHIKAKRSLDLKKSSSRQHSMDGSRESDAPLFDPSLMARFEQAVMATSKCSDEDWLQHSMDEITTNSSASDNTWPLSEMASDAESIPHWLQQEKGMHAQIISPPNAEKGDLIGLLAKYEIRCPARGDGKVVLYHTSMRGVRKTYQDCCAVKLMLKGLGLCVDERDVWMHAKYKEELLDVLGDVGKGVPLVPRLFVKGRYIGGVDEVKMLHEDGSLAKLVDGMAMDVLRAVCDGCGDVRFVPCLKCSGSCKIRNWQNEVSQCLACNENGLIMCPVCTT